MTELSILFIGVGNPIPSFIYNRISYLDQTGEVRVYVLAHANCKNVPVLSRGKVYKDLPLTGRPLRTICHFLLRCLTKPAASIKLWRCMSGLPRRQRERMFIRYNIITSLKHVDVVHLQWLGMASGMKWLGKYFNAPVISSARGSQITVYPETSAEYETNIRECIRASDYVHAVSEDIAGACMRYGADKSRIIVNYNGIDHSLFSRQTRQSKEEETVLVSTGALIWRKGFIWQLMLMRALKGKGIKARLVIIGDGPDRQGLQYTAFRMGLNDTVHFAGTKLQNEVADILASSDIYISTSAAEGLPNAVMEAAASGLPVVAFETEGIRELVINDSNGSVVPFGDFNALLTSTENLITDRELRMSMGAIGHDIVVKKFDHKENVAKMVMAYKAIIIRR